MDLDGKKTVTCANRLSARIVEWVREMAGEATQHILRVDKLWFDQMKSNQYFWSDHIKSNQISSPRNDISTISTVATIATTNINKNHAWTCIRRKLIYSSCCCYFSGIVTGKCGHCYNYHRHIRTRETITVYMINRAPKLSLFITTNHHHQHHHHQIMLIPIITIKSHAIIITYNGLDMEEKSFWHQPHRLAYTIAHLSNTAKSGRGISKDFYQPTRQTNKQTRRATSYFNLG